MEKRWVIQNENVGGDLEDILLNNRSISNKDPFFQPHLYKLTSPEKLFAELDRTVGRIKKAIKNKELIYIYGDFDVDGITGTAILWETINFLGGKVLPYIPHREQEGYGIHSDALAKLAKEGAKVVISVDCGITATEEAKTAKKLDVDLIITDHHSIQKELPKAFSLIYTDKLAGSGVAFMLAKRLLEDFNKDSGEQFSKNLELAAIGTIADMVPLTGDNRIIVTNGLHNLTVTKRRGLKALYEESRINKKIGTYEVGYIISPRLNAAGRMETALDALRLLLTSNQDRASKLAEKLTTTNEERRKATAEGLEHAKDIVKEDGRNKMIVVHSDSYLPGIIGLVAGRLVDEFYKPTIVISETQPLCKGSARSVKGYNITEAISGQEKFLKSFGGHPMAAGFSLEQSKIPHFKDKILNHAEKTLEAEDLIPVLKIDARLDTDLLNKKLLEFIKRFEPFGIGNPEPTFVSDGLEVADTKKVGKEKNHLRMVLRTPNYKVFNCIGFGLGEKNVKIGDKIDAVYNLKEDNFYNSGRLELKIKDLRITK